MQMLRKYWKWFNREDIMKKSKRILSIMTALAALSISMTSFAMTTEEFDKNTQLGLKLYNSGLYSQAKDELQKFCDKNWDTLNKGQQEYIQGYLDDAKQKSKQASKPKKKEIVGEVFAPLTTEEFDAGMSKGIDYFNKNLYHEAYDEFKWFRDARYEDMNPEQQKYIDEYLYGAKVKRDESEPYWYNKEYDSMGWVYAGRDLSGRYLTYTGSYYSNGELIKQGRYKNYTFVIPKFNSKSESIRRLNNRMYNDTYKLIDTGLRTLKENGYASINYTKYWESKYNNYVSAVIETQAADDDSLYYSAGTINIAENKEVPNTELVAKTGYSEEQFLDILEAFMADKCYNANKAFFNKGWGNFDKLKSLISSAKYRTINVPMSVDDNGHLIVYANIPTLVASGSIRCIIDTGLMVY